MIKNNGKNEIKDALISKLSRYFGVSPEEATAEQMYKAVVLSIRDQLAQNYKSFQTEVKEAEAKRVYYICMEFLIGRSMKNNLLNLQLEKQYGRVIGELGFE
ncbi:MAG: alpha-glucan phosphorylase, partial [Firmicutes bacterium HGW-Firmicutes-21]